VCQQFTPQGIAELLPVLEDNRTLTDVRCPGHELKETDEARMIEWMKRNKKQHALVQHNWLRISVLLAFVRANAASAVRNCILPLIPSILETAVAPAPPIKEPRQTRLERFMLTKFFQNSVA
jgi:hypothetical protein